ncbi:MAG TPA: hypothetical protein VHZ07_09505 [Bryobacteraceae bacterium]|nr:hypothetical protein [Bryobacteraceae bacterium]
MPRTRDDFFAKPEADQETWSKVLRTIAKMRTDRLSLSKAAKEAGVKSQTVVRWAGRAIKKQPNGRYSVSKTDSLLRVMRIPSNEGQQEVSLRNSKYGSTVGRYMDAVQKYLRTGDSSALKKFRGKKVKDANGNEIRLVTDLKELNRLGSAGVLSFESVYARSV